MRQCKLVPSDILQRTWRAYFGASLLIDDALEASAPKIPTWMSKMRSPESQDMAILVTTMLLNKLSWRLLIQYPAFESIHMGTEYQYLYLFDKHCDGKLPQCRNCIRINVDCGCQELLRSGTIGTFNSSSTKLARQEQFGNSSRVQTAPHRLCFPSKSLNGIENDTLVEVLAIESPPPAPPQLTSKTRQLLHHYTISTSIFLNPMKEKCSGSGK